MLNKIKFNTLKLLRNREFLITSAFFLLILFIFLINGMHERYPDEFDNVLGGKYILSGQLIYKEWFTHHGPFPYFLSALINLFGGTSFVHFRIIYSLILFLITVGSYLYIRKSVKGIATEFYLLVILFISISSTYFWGHMMLADSLAAFFLMPVYGLTIIKLIYEKTFTTKDYIFISVLSGLALLSALTYAYLVAGLFVVLGINFILEYKRKINFLYAGKIILILLAPYILFLLYLLLTGSIKDYFYQAIVFNRDYYIYYPGHEGKPPTNPLRYAIVMLQGFHNNFSSMLNTVKGFNFDFPFNITLAVGNVAFGIFLLFKRKYLAFLLMLGVLVYANARTNPFSSGETDYQSAVYIMISIFNLCFALFAIYKMLNLNIEFGQKLILSLIFILLLVYSFFGFTFVLRKFSYKAYDKYMGFAPAIYDAPKVSPLINHIVEKDSYAWIGPFGFEELYYLNPKVPSRYQILLPGMGASTSIPPELLSEFNANKPEVIYFDKDQFILGNNPSIYGKFFVDFLNDNYTTLDKEEGYIYTPNVDQSLLFGQKLFIRNDIKEDIINRMIEKGMVTSE